MKILLVSAPLEFPLAVYCLAAQLLATPDLSDCSVEFLHLDASRLNSYDRKSSEIWRYVAFLDAARPDLIAFSVYLWSNLSMRELIAITRCLHPHAFIVVGGPELGDPSAAASFLSCEHVTAAVRGEGELTMVELVRQLAAGRGPSGVPGCSWQAGDGVVHEAPRPAIHTLSQLASPFLSGLVPDDLFDRAPARKGRFPRALLETYRGCYMECSYCQWGNGSNERHSFGPERVKRELSWLLSRGVSRLFIVDAMFGFKKEWAKELLRHIIGEKRRFGATTTIVCYHNQDYFDHELFDLYREADVTVEIDLQSTSKEVLARVGRGKWYVESFDRHLTAFREHRVPTTGSSDLIIGLPRDHLASFADSVDFLLTRGMSINLQQTFMIPNTPMARSATEDGVIFSSHAPRAVLKNGTFPVSQMVAARLIGHGVDFFRRFPCTARLLARQGFNRPVDLCQRIGDLVWRRLGVMYERESDPADPAVSDCLFASLLGELCTQDWLLPVLEDLFSLEAALARMRSCEVDTAGQVFRVAEALLPAESWLGMRLRYRREEVREVRIEHSVEKVLQGWSPLEELPPESYWRELASTWQPRVALVHSQPGALASLSVIDESPAFEMLRRFSGFFSVAQCLESISAAYLAQNLDFLRRTIESLMTAGVVVDMECEFDSPDDARTGQ